MSILEQYLERIWFFWLMIIDVGCLKRLRGPSDSVVLSWHSRAILRGAHELDPTTLHDEVGGWWVVVYTADRVAVAQEPSFIHLQGVDLPATVGNRPWILSSPYASNQKHKNYSYSFVFLLCETVFQKQTIDFAQVILSRCRFCRRVI